MKVESFSNSIDKFIYSLDNITQVRALRILELLEKYENNLGMPYSKSLKGGLFELRILGANHVRLIYCFHKEKIIILNAFTKKTNKIPPRELELATKRHKTLA